MRPLPSTSTTGPSGPTRRVLVVGAERSGTTWLAGALSEGLRARYVHEPDSPGVNPRALHASSLGRYPVLEPGQDGPALADYEALWDLAFSGRWPLRPVPASVVDAFSRLPAGLEAPLTAGARRVLQGSRALKLRLRPVSPGRPATAVLVKSVYALFCLEWLADRTRPDHLVVVRRRPAAIASSMVRLGTSDDRFDRVRRAYGHPTNQRRFVEPLGLPALPHHLDVAEACAWWAAFATIVLEHTAARHPEWHQVSYDDVARAPTPALVDLLGELGGGDPEALGRFVARSARPGRGYSTRRVLGGEAGGLEPEARSKVAAVLARFGQDL